MKIICPNLLPVLRTEQRHPENDGRAGKTVYSLIDAVAGIVEPIRSRWQAPDETKTRFIVPYKQN
jgi:hypothetical protein